MWFSTAKQKQHSLIGRSEYQRWPVLTPPATPMHMRVEIIEDVEDLHVKQNRPASIDRGINNLEKQWLIMVKVTLS
jgi:hypothetical protein